MVISDLLGGLGNQLFQYAAGKYLAELNQTEFKISTLNFETYKLHKYSLQHFNISAPIATAEEVQHYGGALTKVWERITLKPYYKRKVFQEQGFQYDENFLKAPSDVMLSGYWQSEKYFSGIASRIREEFIINSPMDEVNKIHVNNIKGTNSVSLHIRRGDYVSDTKTSKIHGACDLEYYDACVANIARLIKDPVFYIFSDDPSWVRRNLNLKFPTIFMDQNSADKNYEDLRLMSLCKHNIIANSSFSWWGAWLNSNPEKYVSAPKNWFKNSSRNSNDIIPDKWQQF